MLHFLCGPAYSGKTTALFSLAHRRVSEGRRVLFFVPEQQTAACEADLLRLCKNRAGEFLEVLNFQRLPNRIFREIGGLCLPTESRTEKALLLAQILRENTAAFPNFSRQAKCADFILEISAFLEELTRSGMTAEQLAALADSPLLAKEAPLCEKLTEAARAYAAYEALAEETLGDLPDEAMRLCRMLREMPEQDFFRGATVILDGFYDFTAPQYELICHMAKTADEVYLSSLESDADPELFSRGRESRFYLQSRLSDADYDFVSAADLGVGERREEAPEDLIFLCDHILKNPKAPFSAPPQHLTLCACETPYEEVARAMRQVLLLHEKEGVDYSDCAILYRDGALYAPLIRELSREYAIPLYTDEKYALADSALALFFTSAAAIAAGDSTAEPLLSLLFSGLSPVSEKAAFLWARYIRTWSLAGAALYREDDYTASIFGAGEMILSSMRAENEEALAAINREKGRLIKPLLSFLEQTERASSAKEKTDALLEFAEKAGVAEAYSRLIDRNRAAGDFSAAAVLSSLFDACLDALRALDKLPGEIDTGFYAQLIRLAFSSVSVGALPSSPDALAAGDITFTRTKKVRHLFLLGLNDECFPRTAESPALFGVRERSLLSALKDGPLFFFKSAGDMTREEYFLFYLACAVPREKLHLSYSLQNLDGNVLRPSVFIRRLEILSPALMCQIDKGEAQLPMTLGELYGYLCAHSEAEDAFTRGARRLFQAHSNVSLPPSEAQSAELRAHAAPARAGGILTVSQAKLATYQKCPYRYFLQYRLMLSEPPSAAADASLGGTIVHAALEHLLKPLSQGRSLLPHLEELTDEAVHRQFQTQSRLLLEQGFQLDSLQDFWFWDLEHSTKRLVKTLREEFSVGKFRPTFFEADLIHTLSPIERTLSDGSRMRISGKADRIDLAPDPAGGRVLARVVDYKTGAHAFDLNQVYNGFDTQLLLYLFTLSENGIPGLRQNVLPAGAYYLRAHEAPKALNKTDLKKREKNPDFADYGFERSGIFLSDESVLHAILPPGVDTETDCVPISYNRSGLPTSPGGLIAEERDFGILKDAVLDFAAEVSEDILAGRFPREPLWKDEEEVEGCRYCPYRAVCRYEGAPCRMMKKADKSTFFDLLQKGGIHRG